MNDFLRRNRGPVFSGSGVDATGGSSGGDMGMGALDQQNMQQQAADYEQMSKEQEESHKEQDQGDAALKAEKAIQVS